MQYKTADEKQSKSAGPLCIREKGNNLLLGDIMERVTEKMQSLRWGKIELIVRDAKVTQINTIDEDRL